MKVKALRGVCVGIENHLAAGATADLDPALVQFLVGIGAVERVPDEPPVDAPAPAETNLKPAKAGKEK